MMIFLHKASNLVQPFQTRCDLNLMFLILGEKVAIICYKITCFSIEMYIPGPQLYTCVAYNLVVRGV